MASPRPDPVLARAGAWALAWTLFVGAWLVLGAQGRATSALWFAGLGPVAAWLAAAGVAGMLADGRAVARGVVTVALTLAAGGLAIALRSGAGSAVFVAAVGWGVLSGAATRRAGAGGAPAFAPGCVPSTPALADPAGWPALGARWAMLPMMAALAVQSDWCAGIGVSAGTGVALHLAAMLAPAALLQRSPRLRVLATPAAIGTLMAASVAALPLLPGLRGWMAMSLVQAVAWSLAAAPGFVGGRGPAPRRGGGLGTRAARALGPAAAALALGATLDAFGVEGLVGVHVALGALSAAGAASGAIVDAWHHAHPGPEEKLS